MRDWGERREQFADDTGRSALALVYVHYTVLPRRSNVGLHSLPSYSLLIVVLNHTGSKYMAVFRGGIQKTQLCWGC